MRDLLRPLLLAVLVFLPVLGCDKASPVAPSGTTLSISANPSSVALNGTSTITVIGRQPNGNPLNPGTEIIFSVDKGSIDPIATIQSNGVATATFHADNRSGTARITVATGGSAGGGTSGGGGSISASVDIQVGLASGDKPTLLLSVSPNSLAVKGNATVTVIARNADGSPAAAGQTIIMTSSLGSLSPSRPTTKSDGTATSTFSAGTQAGTAKITAVLGSSDAATADVTIRDQAAFLGLSASPATIGRADSQVTLTATVANAQQQPLSGASVTFSSTLGSITPVVFTGSDGSAQATLTVKASEITSTTTKITVTASTPGTDSKSVDIPIR